jgi:hypothetical protein
LVVHFCKPDDELSNAEKQFQVLLADIATLLEQRTLQSNIKAIITLVITKFFNRQFLA